MKKQYTHTGFTLLETLIYIALFASLLTGALGAVYQLIRSQTLLTTLNTSDVEAAFVLAKLEHALHATKHLASPHTGQAYSTVLDIVTTDNTEYVFRLHSSAIELSEDGGNTFLPLTNERTRATALGFHYVAGAGGMPDGVEGSTTLSGKTFFITRYFTH